jgi:hypothetical protein
MPRRKITCLILHLHKVCNALLRIAYMLVWDWWVNCVRITEAEGPRELTQYGVLHSLAGVVWPDSCDFEDYGRSVPACICKGCSATSISSCCCWYITKPTVLTEIAHLSPVQNSRRHMYTSSPVSVNDAQTASSGQELLSCELLTIQAAGFE